MVGAAPTDVDCSVAAEGCVAGFEAMLKGFGGWDTALARSVAGAKDCMGANKEVEAGAWGGWADRPGFMRGNYFMLKKPP